MISRFLWTRQTDENLPFVSHARYYGILWYNTVQMKSKSYPSGAVLCDIPYFADDRGAIISLPISPVMTEDEVGEIVAAVNAWTGGAGGCR